MGLLLLASACSPANTVAKSQLDGVVTLSAGSPAATFETTYCLEELQWQTVAVSATFSVAIDADGGQEVSLRLLDPRGDRRGDGGSSDGSDGSDGSEDSTEEAAELARVDVRSGNGTISLQRLEDWSGVSRRCAAAVVQVSADGLEGEQVVGLHRPRVQVSGLSHSGACEDPQLDSGSFSIELTQR